VRLIAAGAALVLMALTAEPAAPQPKTTTAHAISMHGDLKYGPGFKHFEYVNPEAPKGGDVKLAAIGTFDSLNPFILKGVPAAGMLALTFETLMVGSQDEPFSEYGLIAESIEVPADRSWVAFTLRPEARFHDGSAIAVEDVIWTFDTLKAKGQPFFRSYYAQVAKAEKVGERKVKFTFGPGENRELPLIVGQLPVLSRAYWAKRDFEKTTLDAPLGSGPYRVEAVEPGRSITFRRVKDYWGAKLPVRVGHYNFDTMRYDYYRDVTVAVEALKGGEYDFRQENVAKNWATAFNVPAVTQGLLRKEGIKNEVPTGMQAFVYNMRRPVFQDARVRKALAYAFDFDWMNKNLFFGTYIRTTSYFSNSELASRGLPGPEELKILEPLRGKIPDEVFTKEYMPPDGSNHREAAREALRLLQEAGWVVKDQKLVNAKTGEPMAFEILISDPTWERIALPFAKSLERLGVTARVRTVDPAQYQNRTDNFDFDMIVAVWGQSLSPGNEQRDFWSSAVAATPGSRNLAGIKDPAVDNVLLWGAYVIPQWHINIFRVVFWDKFGRPAINPRFALGFATWWVDAQKEAALGKRRGEVLKK
jgi:microcin C transport system substrate-binding protein